MSQVAVDVDSWSDPSNDFEPKYDVGIVDCEQIRIHEVLPNA